MKIYLKRNIDFKNLKESVKKAVPLHEIDETDVSKYDASIIKIKENFYTLNFYNLNYLGNNFNIWICEPIEYQENPKNTFESNWTCPYCGYIDLDSWELNDEEDDYYCPNCQRLTSSRRIVSVYYEVYPEDKNEVIYLK